MRVMPFKESKPLNTPATKEVRLGEEDKHWFRCDRFFLIGNQWFFSTREGKDVGPYDSREQAQHGLNLFIECITKQHTDAEYAADIASKGDWAITQFH